MPFSALSRVACVLALVCAGALPTSNAGAQEIVVGQCAPLSGSLAKTGQDMALGVRLAIDAANAGGGINGRRIRLVQKDDGYDTERTVNCTQELIEKDRAVALIGYAGTGNVGELLRRDVLAKAGIALVAPYTGGTSLREPYNPWIFHIRASYADEAERMVDQFARIGLNRIAVFYQNDAFGLSGVAGVEKALQKYNLAPIAKGSYEKNTEDIDRAVAEIARNNPQAVIIAAITRPAALFVRKLRELSPAVQVFSISVVDGAEVYRIAGEDMARGFGMTQVMPSPFSGTQAVVREYRAALVKYGKGAEPSYASLEEYIGGRVLVDALRRVTGPVSPANVLKSLETLQTDVGGYRVAFGPTQRAGSRFVEVTVIGRGGTHLK